MVPERDTIGRYELLLELGRGGMAVLHLARAQGVGGFSRLFAIKQILPHLAADPPFVEMFLNEARIAARLSHPNVCPVFELAHERGELFLVMDYLDGVSWETLAAAAPRDARGLQLAAGVLAQACDGLHHAHTFRDLDGQPMPIVHRDVSPQNVFVSADGVCRVLDFGVSKVATDHRRTRTGLLKGKLPYMAPEHVRGEPLDARADIWAVGVMLWEALTGERLFDRDTDFLTYLAIVGADIPSVNARALRYPAAIDRVIARALARDRDARYATARELADDLQHVAGGPGGAATREQIADAVARLCGAELAARRGAIAAAVARRAGSPAAPASTSPTRPGEPHPGEPHSGLPRPGELRPGLPRPGEPRPGLPRPGEPRPGEPRPGELRPGEPRNPATTPDAAATLSMAMRNHVIVVARRRRRWTTALAALGVALAAVVALAVHRHATPADSAPAGSVPAGSAPAGSAPADSAPVPAPSSPQPAGSAVTAPLAASGSASAPDDPAPAVGNAAPHPSPGAAPSPGRSREHGHRATSTVDRPASSVDDVSAIVDGAASSVEDTSAIVDRALAAADRARSAADHAATTLDRAATTIDRATHLVDRTATLVDRAAGTAEPAPMTGAGSSARGVPADDSAPPSGWYAIDSEPRATIYIDDRKLGDTPLDRIPLPAGPHRVRAVLPDRRQRSFTIDIAANRRTSSGTLTW